MVSTSEAVLTVFWFWAVLTDQRHMVATAGTTAAGRLRDRVR